MGFSSDKLIPTMKTCIKTTSFVFFYLLLTAFQCRPNFIVIASNTDLIIEPNPVFLIENKGEFTFEAKFPPGRFLAKVDSISIEFLVGGQSNSRVLGKSDFMIDPKMEETENAVFGDRILFEYPIAKDTVPFLMNLTLISKGNKKTSPSLQVGLLIRNQ